MFPVVVAVDTADLFSMPLLSMLVLFQLLLECPIRPPPFLAE